MSDLILSPKGSRLPARVERQLAREGATIHARTSVRAAAEVAKLEAITEITEEALFGAAEVASVADMLTSRTPSAERALAHIASAGISAMADVVMRSGRRLQ